jgi:uncharacterized protein YfaS (alpha-2-macroglobulin family)
MSLLFLVLIVIAPVFGQSNTKKLWDNVAEATKKGLPQTAIDNLKLIYKTALSEGRKGEALRAITTQIVMESTIKGNKPEYKVNRLKEEIARADDRMKPIMKTLLAQWYWYYFSRNKYRFINRTATEGLNEEDFTTWDLKKIFKEISSIHQDLLKNGEPLKSLELSQFKDVLSLGNVPGLRPTLYDFVAYKAIEFYSSGEQAGARPEDAFVIDASSGALGDADAFISFTPATTDTESPQYLALKIYRDLLLFHKKDGNKDAFIDTDISRLHYVYSHCAGDKKDEIYMRRMKEIAERNPSSELSSLALYYLASAVSTKGDFVEAYNIATKGKNAHPKSYGAALCTRLIATITEKKLELKGERTIAPDRKSPILVTYRNIDRVSFRVIKDSWKDCLTKKGASYNLFDLDNQEAARLLTLKPEAEWTAQLKLTGDYKTKQCSVSLPALKPGFYRVFASYKNDFSKGQNCMSYCNVWVSSIGVVTRVRDDIIEGFVVNSESGAPAPQVAVTVYGLRDYNAKSFQAIQTVKTDADGLFTFTGISRQSHYRIRLAASDGKGSDAVDGSDLYPSPRNQVAPYRSTVFFTDRAIYRPGQTVNFKGIVMDIDQAKVNYKVVPGQNVTVHFRDVNSQEISSVTVTSNDFGSFSGKFTTPTDRLMGQMYLVADSPQGTVSFRVEEYKRPKFMVDLSPPKEGYRLNDEVSVTGEAQSYAGAPIDDARVSYRVVREVHIPYWWSYFFYRGGMSTSSQEIAHGTVKTDTSGKFAIKFPASPDLSVSKEAEPVFSFRVYADVTDSAGETHSDSTYLRIGYASMEASMSASEWQTDEKPVKITVSTTSLNYISLPASGLIEIYNLKEPSKPQRTEVTDGALPAGGEGDEEGPQPESSADMNRWPLGSVVDKKQFSNDGKMPGTVEFNLKAGAYRAKLTTQDRFGAKVTALLPIVVSSPGAQKFPIRVPSYYTVKSNIVEAGETFRALWGTGYESGQAFVEILQNGRLLKKFWTGQGRTQSLIDFPVSESLRGGFTVIATSVRENRIYTYRRDVTVPWSNKRLDVSLETFRSKLAPGAQESWTLRVKGPGAEKKAAELAATLYDESLDAFVPHHWGTLDRFFAQNYTRVDERYTAAFQGFTNWFADWHTYVSVQERVYPEFISELVANLYGYEFLRMRKASAGKDDANFSAGEPMCESAAPCKPAAAPPAEGSKGNLDGVAAEDKKKEHTTAQGGESSVKQDLSSVKARKNLNETAFFFPHLLTDKDGSVKITFTMPEALTKWHLIALAHGKELESGLVEGHAVTQKDLMVQPNAPRFLREGDQIEFSVKVTNMAEKEIKGAVRLNLFSPDKDTPLDDKLGNKATDQELTIPAKQSRSFSWRLSVPDGLKMLGYRAVASAGTEKDGEEGVIPVIARRILVKEAIPLWVRGPGERKFTFKKLAESAGSTTLVNEGYTVQMASNPAWYAVQALPFLMEFPHECSEQVFNRLYANGLARHIAGSDPKIRAIFDQWKNEQPDALLSNLEKNESLKNVMLLETPWVLEAKSESAAKRQVGILFDDTRMKRELDSAYSKLRNMQLSDGSWPWFPGGRGNSFITLYIVTGFGRLGHLKAEVQGRDCALRGVDHLDRWINEIYQEIKKHGHLKENNLSTTIALYLYGRSFFLKDRAIPAQSKEAVDYFLSQAAQHWLKLGNRMSQGHLALALNRFGNTAKAKEIMASIKERSQTDEELGMFWSETELSWWWYRAPIETQALMIEAFDEIMNDAKSVEECKVWLLKQKQTQDWKTTKATSDAIYGLLCRGENLLAATAPVEMTVGGTKVEPEKIEAGTGFYEKRYSGSEVKPSFGEIVVKKSEKGIAWGGAHWQYMEDISKVTPHTQNPLTLKKTVFLQKNEKSGPVIQPVSGPLTPGDLLKIRIELRVDRDMEYVHMKDSRGSGLEPTNVLSQYKYQDGLFYYESTRDTATHFYIDYLPKGTYVFEYPLQVVNRGRYQNGLAEIECMYAPEFNSHSDSVILEVR